MKTSEKFALNEWLSDYPEDLEYYDILEMMSQDDWSVDGISVWEVVENFTLDQVSDLSLIHI